MMEGCPHQNDGPAVERIRAPYRTHTGSLWTFRCKRCGDLFSIDLRRELKR